MGNYRVSRSASVAADPALVHRLLNDLHEWPAWSPWEDVDPAMERTYGGAESGVGAHYAWSGNRRAGQGSMEITGSSPERIDLTVTFLKPFRSTSDLTFELASEADRTDVTWVMTGQRRGVLAVLGTVVPLDRRVGRDFEKGLARLKVLAED